MKLILRNSLYNPSPTFATQLKDKMESLRSVLQIDEARVFVERRPEVSPPFRLSAQLVVPGPDISVEAVDHTLRAALHKLMASIHARIGLKRIKQASRVAVSPKKTSPRMKSRSALRS